MSIELPIDKVDKWLWTYFKSMFILSRTYNPEDEIQVMSIKCFFQNVINLMPNKYIKTKFTEYVYMNSNVKNMLLTNPDLQSFFKIYSNITEVIKYSSNQFEFLDFCLKSNFTAFIWVYLMQAYYITLLNKYGNYVKIPSFNEFKASYEPDRLSKDDWGNSLWFVMHVSALYGTGDVYSIFENYKAMLSCLQYILPCPKCRQHLIDNLAYIDIDSCGSDRMALFKCSWELHNIVNESLGKRQPSFQEALGYYNF